MRTLLSSMRFNHLVKHPFSYAGTWLLHIALMVIIIGACVTHFFGVQGEVHLRADKAQTLNHQSPITNHQSRISLFLWDFQIISDKDGNPADFISELRLLDRQQAANALSVDEGKVQMNKPLKYHGWRFCQSDYDSDGQGVVLSYNYDPWGIGITYTGYALLLLGMIAFFFQKNTYFRVLLKRQHTWLMVGLGIVAIILAFVMTKVVTPKPPLQPVLQTPLLGIHVSVIMLAYTLFAVIMLNGLIALINTAVRKINGKMVNDKMVNGLMQLSQLLLYPAVFCLAIGIFIGAVWANLSWGRYWGWDPKETWALITMIVYALLLHWPVLKGKLHLGNDLTSNKYQILYHIFSIIAFAFVLFTYFGVNRLLGGLHSYA